MSDCLGIKFLSDDMMAFISSQKKGGTNGKLHCVTVSFNFFLSDYKSLYIGAGFVFTKDDLCK